VADATKKFVLYQDLDGTIYDVELPLTSNVNPEELRERLGLPSYIDLNYFPMRSAMVTLWAAVNAPKLHELYPHVFEKRVSKKPIQALLFGGGAVKIRCKSANAGGALARTIHDTDFIVPKKQGLEFYKLLLNMDEAFGTQYKSFLTKNDMRFNAWRHGERYRVTTINGITNEGIPTITVVDLFCDSIDLRHRVEVKDAFKRFSENLYTIGLECLLLSKAQFIFDIQREKMKEIEECGQDFRILPYSHYAEDKIIIGMEEKDMKDACAVFLDHEIGRGPEEIDSQKIKKVLKKNKRFALTVTLNLRNIIERQKTLAKWMAKSEVSTVVARVEALLRDLPKVDQRWDKPWWNTAVETPVIQ
jgi:hypothetical protein